MGPTLLGQQSLKVSDLLNPHLNTWNLEKIDQFMPHYKSMILTLKPSLLGALDKKYGYDIHRESILPNWNIYQHQRIKTWVKGLTR